MQLYIKHMVCPRCITAVESELAKLNIDTTSVELGMAEIKGDLTPDELLSLGNSLKKIGFELIEDKKSRIIENIKTEIIHHIHYADELLKTNLSFWLSEKTGYDYTYLSNVFSETEGSTIEKYYIAQRIERVKELLAYGELSLSQIADSLGYSSAAYLSSQFKKITGLTPTSYKSAKESKRKSIDEL